LDAVEDLLKEDQVTIGVLDQKAQKHLTNTEEIHATAEAHANTNIKLQEDLNRCVATISQRKQEAAEREQGLQEKEEEIVGMLEHVHDNLTSHGVNLDIHETTVETEHERLRKMRVDLLNHELTISF
jgi:uncharacterized protein (DUF3084 family)